MILFKKINLDIDMKLIKKYFYYIVLKKYLNLN